MASYLNPWLARHAVLVCSTVKARFSPACRSWTAPEMRSGSMASVCAGLPRAYVCSVAGKESALKAETLGQSVS